MSYVHYVNWSIGIVHCRKQPNSREINNYIAIRLSFESSFSFAICALLFFSFSLILEPSNWFMINIEFSRKLMGTNWTRLMSVESVKLCASCGWALFAVSAPLVSFQTRLLFFSCKSKQQNANIHVNPYDMYACCCFRHFYFLLIRGLCRFFSFFRAHDFSNFHAKKMYETFALL